MVGKSAKPVLDLCILDSVKNGAYRFDEHTVVLYAAKPVLRNIYFSVSNESEYDSLKKYDYSFGTFHFAFHFENNEKFKIVANRIRSIELFKRIIAALNSKNPDEGLIKKEIEENLLQRINY